MAEPKQNPKKSKSLSIDDILWERLVREAARLDLSTSQLIRKALKSYLDASEKRKRYEAS